MLECGKIIIIRLGKGPRINIDGEVRREIEGSKRKNTGTVSNAMKCNACIIEINLSPLFLFL